MNVYVIQIRTVVILVTLCVTSLAFAQRSYQRAEGDVERLLEDARSAYENFELDQAESDLERAIRLIDRFDMRTPLAADVFVQMGIVVFAKKRDSRRATDYFQRAVEADGEVELDRNSANPSMERLFQTARSRANRSGSSGRGGGRLGSRNGSSDRGGRYDDRRDQRGYESRERRYDDRAGDRRRPSDRDRRGGFDDRSSSRDRADRRGDGRRDARNDRFRSEREQLRHEAPSEAPSDRALELWMNVDPDTNREIYQLFVYFRSAATSSIQKAVMRAAGATEFRVTIPRRYVVGREFVYYFVAESRSGRKVASLGSPRSPFKVRLSGDLLGGASRFASGSSLEGGYGYGDESSGGNDKFAFSLGAGSGAGYVTKLSKPVRNKESRLQTEGFGPAVLHLLLEMDAWVTDSVSLGAFGRIQVVEFASLFGARLQYRLSNKGRNETRLRFGGGYGRVRHLVKIEERNDTTLDGPYCANGGFVHLYKLSDSMKFKSGLDYIQLFGSQPSYHFDVSLGIELSF